MRLGLRLGLDEIGPTWAAVWLRRIGLGRVAEAFGIGCHSDRQLKNWAIDREHTAKNAYQDALRQLHRFDREEAHRIARKHFG